MDDKTRNLMFSSENPNFETPDDLFERYKKKYNITLDVCATLDNAKIKENFISPQENCLVIPWNKRNENDTGFAWKNPPYNKPEMPCKKSCKNKRCVKRGFHSSLYVPGQIDFVRKAFNEAKIGNRSTVCLLPARTDTDIFFEYIWDEQKRRPKDFTELEFLRGRLTFKGMEDPAPFPSMIVVFFTYQDWLNRSVDQY